MGFVREARIYENKPVEERERNGMLQHLTSILPQLRHYRRLKIITNFAAAGSLESVWEPQLRQYAGSLGAMPEVVAD